MALNLEWSRVVVSAALLGLLLAPACGGDPEKPPLSSGTGATTGIPPITTGGASGADGSGGTDAGGDTGAGGEVGGALAPIVHVTSPQALSNPDGEVLTDDEIEVRCTARQAPDAGSFPVEPSSVTIEVLNADGEVVEEVDATPGEEADEFSANVLLTGVTESGRIGFRCSASDAQVPPLTGTHTVHSLIDHGPLIEVDAPEEGGAFAQASGLVFDFTVRPSPLTDDDDRAAVDEVLLDVNGVSIDPGEPDDGRYRFSVDLTDRELFNEVPDGEIPITLRARNRRQPEPVERFLSYPIVIDGEGPAIVVETPSDRDVVGGLVTVRFTVQDELSDVDEASVAVKVGNEEYRFDPAGLWERDGPTFTFRFDSTLLEASARVQALLNVHASDAVGNRSDGESILIYFDNVPPIIDLDPEYVRIYRDSGQSVECSQAFDPVGDNAPNDRDVVPRLQQFRAIVWERTNYTTDQSVLFYAGTDEASARVYIERDPSVPLLIDTNADGLCDELAIEPDEQGELMNFVRITPIPRAGSAWFGPEDEGVAPTPLSSCSFASQAPPDMLCDDESDLSVAIAQDTSDRPPAIYAIGVDEGPACTGIDWEFGSISEEGWLCFAARVVDRVGNVGISRPLRLCYDDVEDGLPPPDCVNDTTPPSCTDGCSLPPAFTARHVED